MVTCASPVYLEKMGMPTTPEEMAGGRHFAVGYLQAQAGRILPMGFSRDGETRDIVPQCM